MALTMQGRRAGVVSRFMADAIDFGIVLATLGGVYVAVAATRFLLHPRRFTWPAPSTMHLVTLGWLLLVAYLTVGWATKGRTFGKTILGLRVVGREGERLPFDRALVRALVCAAVPIGLFWCVVSAQEY